jgi:hypothetical protein
MGIFDDDEEVQKLLSSEPVKTTSEAIKPTKTTSVSIFDDDENISNALNENETEETVAVSTIKRTNQDPDIVATAKRFVKDRLGMDNVTDEEAMEEYIAHFRSFNVNEITAGGDYNYVSGLAADAEEPMRNGEANVSAQQRLEDYRTLYQNFQEMPAFEDGFFSAVGDYGSGLLTAPSTYVGLLLPGIGKGAGVATTQAAKIGIGQILRNPLKNKIISSGIAGAMARPIRTTIAVEGAAGALQDVAAQGTEIAADLRDERSLGQTALAFGISGVTPVALAGGLIKGKGSQFIERNTGELVEEGLDAESKIIVEAGKKADKVLEKNTELVKTIKQNLRALDPEMVAAGETVREVTEEGIDILPSQMVAMTPEHTKRILAGVTEAMVEGGVKLEPGERVVEGVARVIRDSDFIDDIMKKYNLTRDDFANLFMAEFNAQARSLAEAGKASKALQRLEGVAGLDIFNLSKTQIEKVNKVNKAIEAGDARKALEETGGLEDAQADSLLKRFGQLPRALDQVRLASMTSQTATTLRNTVSGAGRVGIDILVKGFDRGFASALQTVGAGKGKVGLRGAPNEDVFGVLYGVINKKEAEAVRTMFDLGFHNKATQLYRQLQDLDDGIKATQEGTKLSKLRQYSTELNALNTASDNLFKRAAFIGSLKRQLNESFTKQAEEIAQGAKEAAEKGIKFVNEKGEIPSINDEDFILTQIIKEGKFKQVFGTKDGQKMLDKAVDEALSFTYQKSPDSSFARAIVQGIHKAPFLTTSLVPFPRFVANAMRFTYEYSPLYLTNKRVLTQLVGKGNEDNYEQVSKALVGTGLYTAAYAFRGSENAGENWWEYKKDDGSTYDMRPFFPAAPFLFVADMVRRANEGDPVVGDRSFIVDAIQALSGTQFRAGFGIYALDSALNDIFSEGSIDEKAEKLGGNFLANIVSTYTIPLTAGQDLYNTFLSPDDERIVRQTQSTNLTELIVNKSLARLPGNFRLQELIEEKYGVKAPEPYETATRGEKLRRMTPITRQTQGILIKQRKNTLEKEMARLKISPRKLTQKTGVPEADQLVNALLGEYADEYIVPVILANKEYKEMPSAEQALFLKSVIDDYRGDLVDLAKLNSKMYGDERYGFDPFQRVAFNKINEVYQKKAMKRYAELYGEPTEDNPYDFERLTSLAKQYESLGSIRK